MNVGQLKKVIAELDDNIELVVTSFDHQFRSVHASVGEAEYLCGNYFNEYHGSEFKSHPDNKVVEVLIFE